MCLESKVQESLARTCRCFKVQSQAEQNLRTARHLKEPFGRLGSQVLGSGGAWGAMAHKSNPYKKAGKWKCTSGDIILQFLFQKKCLLAPGTLEVPLEVEEEAHAPLAEEAPKDAPALEVRRPACLTTGQWQYLVRVPSRSR